MEEVLNSFAQKYYNKSASLDHGSLRKGRDTTPQTHSLAIIISHDRAGIEDIFDLLHELAVGPLHHHYAAVSAFCVNRFKLKMNTFRKNNF